MRLGFFSFLGASLFALCAVANTAHVATPALRVMTHSSFALPKPLLAQFESQADVKLRIIKGGDAGEMLNKLILTRAKPVADVVFGIDNALIGKALAAQVIDPYSGPAATSASAAPLPDGMVPVDYGYVTVNYDKAWFEKKGVPLPQSLQDLSLPIYAKLLVVQNPATSSPGNAFMLSSIGAMGEEKAFEWWARMRANGVKVVKGWSEAYYTEFTQNGGSRPLVVSYATSPAAEVFYSKTKLVEPPTGSLSLPGGVFRQVEGVALIKGGGQRVAAGQFIEFMRSPAVQQAIQTEMWMYPAAAGANRVEAMRFAREPTFFDSPDTQAITTQSAAWVSRWIKVVLK